MELCIFQYTWFLYTVAYYGCVKNIVWLVLV